MAVMMFTNSVLWFVYGYAVVDDQSVMVPNLVGAFVASIQLIVHLAFYMGIVKAKAMGVRMASL